jgi:catechol 2,3-dioxygenase-like lactoylglutathione lyase family enzyme
MADREDLRSYAFVLAVRDLAASAAYFQDALGFRLDWAEADDWRVLSRGGVRFMLGHCPNETPPADIGAHSYVAYLEIDDVAALHAEITARGAIIRQPPADKPWKMREMLVGTPDGHRIMVGQPI